VNPNWRARGHAPPFGRNLNTHPPKFVGKSSLKIKTPMNFFNSQPAHLGSLKKPTLINAQTIRLPSIKLQKLNCHCYGS
jgi:hypothetical protein